MENEEKFSVDTEELKNETKATVNQVKDTIKNVDFKNDAEETKGFLKEMFSNPFEAVKRAASGEDILKRAIMIMIVFVAASLISEVIYLFKGSYGDFLDKVFDVITSITYPLFYILVPSVVILLFNKENKKPLTTVISTIVVASVPTVVNYVINIVDALISGISIVTGPIGTTLGAITTILTYFGMKELLGVEEHKDFIKKYAIIKLIAAFVLVVLIRIGIA